mmetsp:Transcript_48526/g.59687  ORF Transcript_48526/g.59687 Transcript_48526/m.59687 type:complete len:380 (+) Transcript_48526:609-1748(+)
MAFDALDEAVFTSLAGMKTNQQPIGVPYNNGKPLKYNKKRGILALAKLYQVDTTLHGYPMIGPYTPQNPWHCDYKQCRYTAYGVFKMWKITNWRSKQYGAKFVLCDGCVRQYQKVKVNSGPKNINVKLNMPHQQHPQNPQYIQQQQQQYQPTQPIQPIKPMTQYQQPFVNGPGNDSNIQAYGNTDKITYQNGNNVNIKQKQTEGGMDDNIEIEGTEGGNSNGTGGTGTNNYVPYNYNNNNNNGDIKMDHKDDIDISQVNPGSKNVNIVVANPKSTNKVQIIKQGWMSKKTKSFMSKYQKRYFVLYSNYTIQYYNNDQKKNPNTTIYLTAVKKIIKNKKDRSIFELSTKEGYWFFQCGTENEANDWMDKIAHCATIVGKK